MATQVWSDGYYTYPFLDLYYNGSLYGREVTPGSYDSAVEQEVRRNPSLNPALFSLNVADVKAFKEIEYRNLADEWFRVNVRAFEGTVIAFKRANNTALNAAEGVVRDKMLANYSAVSTAITNLRASNAGWRTLLETPWTPPSV